MVVSLDKNIAIKDTEDSFVRELNTNFSEMHAYFEEHYEESEDNITLYDLLMSISTIITIGYLNKDSTTDVKWFVNGVSSTEETINTNVGSMVAYKVTKPSGVHINSMVANQTTYIDVSSLTPNTKVVTIHPTQTDTTVEINVVGTNPYEFHQVGNTISVSSGTMVEYKVSKEGYDTVDEIITVTDNITIDVTCPVRTVLFTINPTPTDAIVRLTASGYEQVGNSIRVPPNTTVNYEVSKEGFATRVGSWSGNEDYTLDIVLVEDVTLTIVPTPSNALVVMASAGYRQDGNSITVGKGSTVTWMVSCDGYYPQNGNYEVTKDFTMKVKLTGI